VAERPGLSLSPSAAGERHDSQQTYTVSEAGNRAVPQSGFQRTYTREDIQFEIAKKFKDAGLTHITRAQLDSAVDEAFRRIKKSQDERSQAGKDLAEERAMDTSPLPHSKPINSQDQYSPVRTKQAKHLSEVVDYTRHRQP
jgi:hypothetical protein